MIGLRYAALRTQGVIEEGQVGETAILDYPTHQDKLIKLLVRPSLPPSLPRFTFLLCSFFLMIQISPSLPPSLPPLRPLPTPGTSKQPTSCTSTIRSTRGWRQETSLF